ncbi:MBL fold metallo-hydrolase [Thalassovita taeanensis]|uniref:Glyoxylase, beta-lactamase superfamily II n=1 Tax=Thalassovita taeanensis TaxID=657014 RepID=A0A1H8ZG23_9RHOB|nr:MBL fold metallo-hydrolase [Thalassovita taeanensis]SEP63187.1 Glyoxylase, beta-lactamase superfamily II [Thalassovita taeanensis]
MQPPDDFDPAPGQAEELSEGLRRIVAPNPSPMTYRGTNTYLLGERDIAVIDPGPESAPHLEAIMAALHPGQRISHIIVTHAHLDHSPLSRALSERTGAPVLAFGDAKAGRSEVMQQLADAGLAGGGEGVDRAFRPDVLLADNEVIRGDGWDMRAVWTPGHFGNHLSFVWEDAIFSGDLVMGWASSLVSPPDGDLTDFMASCERLQQIPALVFHPGHGAPVTQTAERLDWLLSHRRAREAAILEALSKGSATADILARAIYTETPAALLPAAARNVFAHLVDLKGKELIEASGALSADAKFMLI